MALHPQTLLNGRYRILAELGRGGMGAVYQARDESLGVDVAIKENLFVSPAFAEAFEREARLLAGLRHPSLPRVTDHFVLPAEGQYLVMDFITGEDLRQRLARTGQPLREADVVGWARHILGALKYLHVRERPIIHRDIKPGNIKLTAEGRAVLVDFGLAKVHDAAHNTATGVRALTPGFSPPEQYGSGRASPRSDIYALGATLYNLLGGQPPEDALQRALGQATLIPLAALNPLVSARLVAVVERCLALKPDDRYANAAEVLAALDGQTVPNRTEGPTALAVLAAPPAPALPPETLRAPAEARARWAWLPATILLALLAVGVGAGATLAAGYAYLRPRLAAFGAATLPTQTAPPTASAAPPVLTPPFLATLAPPQASATAQPATAVVPTAASASATSTASPTETVPAAVTAVGGGSGQIAFASERNGLPQIFLIDASGTQLTQLTNVAEGACQPAWSPDGDQLLFVTPCTGKAERYPSSAIYLMGADGSQTRPLIARLGGAYEPDWSVAGIVFTHLDGGRPQLYLADASGGNLQRLSATNSGDSQASWAPEGARLAFQNFSRSGQMTIYWMLPDGTFARGGTNPEAVTRGAEASSPAWSPDDQWVAYVANRQLYLIDWTARGFGELLLSAEGPNADPAWSPDAQWLVFESWRDGGVHDLYRLPATGGTATRLTHDPALDYQPAWRP